jgi:hypothetical protein
VSTPNPTPQLKIATRSMMAGAYVGTPVSLIVVWYLNTFIYPGKITLEVATAVGGVTAQIVAVTWHIIQQLLAKAGLEA